MANRGNRRLRPHTGIVWAALACALLVLPAQASQTAASLREAAAIPLQGFDGEEALRLEDLHGQWVAVHFLLAAECPYCLLYTLDYANRAGEFPEVTHVFVKPSDEAATRKWFNTLMAAQEDTDAYAFEPPRVRHDPQARLARALHLRYGYEYREATMHFPAFVLFAPTGEERFRYIGKDTVDRFGFDRFSEMMMEIRRPFDIQSLNLPEFGYVIIDGYDPVSYFTEGKAVRGDPEITEVFHGVVARFSTEEHRALFREDPMRYFPAYGGWCALNVAQGRKSAVDPRSFLVHDERLYLFKRGVFNHARSVWNMDTERYIAEADKHWPAIARNEPEEDEPPR